MFDLGGKTALVTGASGGIGGAIARALHAQGATVALSGTRVGALNGWPTARRSPSRRSPAISPMPRRRAAAQDAEAALGHIDILVNNAGLTRDMLAMRMRDEDWQAVLDVNLTAGFRLRGPACAA